MKKTIFEEMGGTYIRHGDYLIPCLTLPGEEEQRFIGVCGKRPFAGKERKECSNETKFIISERRIIMTKGLFKTKPLMILALALVMVFCLSFGAFAAEYPASYV